MGAPTGKVQFVQDASRNDPNFPGGTGSNQEVAGIISRDNGFDAGTRPSLSFNGAFTDGYGANVTNGWVGIDPGVVVVPTDVFYAPRFIGDFDVRVQGMAVPSTVGGLPNDGSLAIPVFESSTDGVTWTVMCSGDGSMYAQRGQWNHLAVTNPTPGSMFRARTPNYYAEFAEFRVYGTYAVGVPWRPCRPILSPGSGRFAGGQLVTLTCPTGGTGLNLFYTTDGSTPVVNGSGVPQGTTTLYTGPFAMPTRTTGPVTIQAIANGHGMTGITVESSEVTTGAYWFLDHPSFVPDPHSYAGYGGANKTDWVFDSDGDLVHIHSGCGFWDPDTNLYYFAGFSVNLADASNLVNDVPPRGICLYSSPDAGLNLTKVASADTPSRRGMILPPCPIDWLNINGFYMSSQTRTRFLRNPFASDPNKKYVMFNHIDTQEHNYNQGEMGVATAPTMAGPWTWTAHSQPTIGGLANCRVNDLQHFSDPADGTEWLIVVTGTPGTSDPTNNTGMYALQLDPATDYTTFKMSGGSAVAVNLFPTISSVRREGIALCAYGGKYFLFHGKLFAYNTTGSNDLRFRSNTGGTSLLTSTWASAAPTSDASVWSTAPGTNDIIDRCQITDIFPMQGALAGSFILLFDGWTPLGSDGTNQLSGSRPVWYYLLPSDFTAPGVVSIPPTRYKWGLEVFTSDLVSGTVSVSSVLNMSYRSTTTTGSGGQAVVRYQFQRAPDVSGAPGVWANVGPNSTALFYDHTGLTPATKYWTRVIKTDALGNSVTSAPVAVTTSSDTAAPSVPSGFGAGVGAPYTLTVSLAWSHSNDDQDVFADLVYRIYKDGTLHATTAPGAVSWSEVLAADDTPHTYAVSAADRSSNESAQTAPASVTLTVGAGSGAAVARMRQARRGRN